MIFAYTKYSKNHIMFKKGNPIIYNVFMRIYDLNKCIKFK